MLIVLILLMTDGFGGIGLVSSNVSIVGNTMRYILQKPIVSSTLEVLEKRKQQGLGFSFTLFTA